MTRCILGARWAYCCLAGIINSWPICNLAGLMPGLACLSLSIWIPWRRLILVSVSPLLILWRFEVLARVGWVLVPGWRLPTWLLAAWGLGVTPLARSWWRRARFSDANRFSSALNSSMTGPGWFFGEPRTSFAKSPFSASIWPLISFLFGASCFKAR